MKQILSAALLLAGATACGGGNNIKQFIIASSNQQVVAGQNADCPSGDPKVKTTPFNTERTFTVYEGQKDKWYLELDKQTTIEGTFKDGTYTFTGSEQTETFIPDLATKLADEKAQSTLTVTFKVDGSTVTGTVNKEDRITCNDLTAASTCKQFSQLAPSGNTIDCLGTATLSGVQLDDPQFKYQTTTPGQ